MTGEEKTVLMDGVATEAQKKEFSKIYRQQYAEAQELFRRFTDQSGDSEQNRVQILADDVGFGKTWVAMILLFGLLSSGKIPRHALIIAPNDLLAHKWIKELRTFMKDYVKGAEAFSVERIRGAESFAERLRGLDEAADKRVRTIGTLLDRHQLGFVAFCLIQYEQVTQFLTRAISRTAEEDKKKSVAYKLKRWLDRKAVRKQAGEFSRFFSQDEAVNVVRFLGYV